MTEPCALHQWKGRNGRCYELREDGSIRCLEQREWKGKSARRQRIKDRARVKREWEQRKKDA